MPITIVDEVDNPIGVRERAGLLPEDIYRVAALWVTNSKNDILMAQRSFSKEHSPGKWGPAVSGTVEQDESYDDNIIKETQEEIGLGLTADQLVKGPKLKVQGEFNDYFCQWYLYQTDKTIEDFVVQENEIEALQWFAGDSIVSMVKDKPDVFVHSINQWINLLVRSQAL